jgi:hypothetical protein
MGPAGAGPMSIRMKQGVEKHHERRQDKTKSSEKAAFISHK